MSTDFEEANKSLDELDNALLRLQERYAKLKEDYSISEWVGSGPGPYVAERFDPHWVVVVFDNHFTVSLGSLETQCDVVPANLALAKDLAQETLFSMHYLSQRMSVVAHEHSLTYGDRILALVRNFAHHKLDEFSFLRSFSEIFSEIRDKEDEPAWDMAYEVELAVADFTNNLSSLTDLRGRCQSIVDSKSLDGASLSVQE